MFLVGRNRRFTCGYRMPPKCHGFKWREAATQSGVAEIPACHSVVPNACHVALQSVAASTTAISRADDVISGHASGIEGRVSFLPARPGGVASPFAGIRYGRHQSVLGSNGTCLTSRSRHHVKENQALFPLRGRDKSKKGSPT